MKFIIDRYIPFIDNVLEPFGEVSYLTPDEITADAVRDADALLIRTRTRVDEKLLSGSRCRFVATATIGMDHFDMEACGRLGVTALNAPGCNAPAVAQYVLSAIGRILSRPAGGATLAVVGTGHIGTIVARWAEANGMNVMRVDPPRSETATGGRWFTLAESAEKADIITFHTPLTRTGKHPTYHLADQAFFDSLKRKPIIINAARGAVVDNEAWLQAIENRQISASVIDVWENEPRIDRRLLDAADIATPHIAGYSLDGKIRATQMVLDALSRHFGLPKLKARAREAVTVAASVGIDRVVDSFDPGPVMKTMRDELAKARDDDDAAKIFERLRDTYELRPEVGV